MSESPRDWMSEFAHPAQRVVPLRARRVYTCRDLPHAVRYARDLLREPSLDPDADAVVLAREFLRLVKETQDA